ncbi:hypothetical protein [Sphaerotilus uruguayifluvii]|uniref:Acyltransferase (DUF342 family) n=1 Tax=Sphaerotilus uruguayifluvii TaxID=2735897 RepID=A0ABX2G253_9BURK|nr:hypothetical protein [Leptothrix sp. C29]NRT55490.1 putative acyltransferase (DUF342 family) [Leptothrix sp. C29]
MKITLLLVALTLLVIVLPLLPALQEWRRPSDVTPLPIDEADALEPDYMARRFGARLDDAIERGLIELGGVPLVHLPETAAHAPWPLDEREVRSGRSRRIWHSDGDCRLPERLHGLAEISCAGTMQAAAGHTYRALRAHTALLLPERVRVLRWAHGGRVVVGDRAVLAGRTSATQSLLLGREVSFSLLHAPVIRFAGAVDARQPADRDGLPAALGPGDGLRAGAPGQPARVEGMLVAAALRHWDGDIDCDGHVSIGEGCRGQGRLRASGTIQIGAGAVLAGGLAAAGEIYLAAGAEVQGSLISESAIVLGAGSVVGRPGMHATVRAPRVDIGKGVVVHGTVWAGSQRVGIDTSPPGPVVIGYDEPVRWDSIARRGLATGSLALPPRSHHDGDLVCQGDLEIGARSLVHGSLKAYGDLALGAGARVEGTLVAPGEIVLGAGSHVGGSVMSETAVVLGPGCIVGAPGRPATVCAPHVEVALGVVVHGTVWAGRSGDAPAMLQVETEGAAHERTALDDDGTDTLDERTPLAPLPGRASA